VNRVLVVDDEPQLLRALGINLKARRYEVDAVATGAEALEAVARHKPDAIILDLGLPDLDGTEVIRGLRGWTKVPIIVLSGRSDAADKVGALDAGADDYVTKPFSMEELLARLRVVLRRGEVEQGSLDELTIGDCSIDLASHVVTRYDPRGSTEESIEVVHLTPTEWGILEVLVRHRGRLVSAKQILNDVWGPGYEKESGYVRFHMAKLRRKLEPDPARPRFLLNEAGMGYRLAV